MADSAQKRGPNLSNRQMRISWRTSISLYHWIRSLNASRRTKVNAPAHYLSRKRRCYLCLDSACGGVLLITHELYVALVSRGITPEIIQYVSEEYILNRYDEKSQSPYWTLFASSDKNRSCLEMKFTNMLLDGELGPFPKMDDLN